RALQTQAFYRGIKNQMVPEPVYRRKKHRCYNFKWRLGGSVGKVSPSVIHERHTETIFISDIKNRFLDPTLKFFLSVYVCISPVPLGGKIPISLLESNPTYSCRCLSSRLYFWRQWKYRRELQLVAQVGPPLSVEYTLQFQDCWGKRIVHVFKPYRPWDALNIYNKSIRRRLSNVTDDLTSAETDFYNLRL
uniref:Chromobox 7 n=1 Tax=Canis lupus familiaris TaxID=9615 RepID=A0A8C0Q957_CANLF